MIFLVATFFQNLSFCRSHLNFLLWWQFLNVNQLTVRGNSWKSCLLLDYISLEYFDHLLNMGLVWRIYRKNSISSSAQDGTEEDPQAELAIIHGQMAYILQLQGRTEEALQLYNQIIKLKPTDVGLLAVIANNIITINKVRNILGFPTLTFYTASICPVLSQDECSFFHDKVQLQQNHRGEC